MTTVSLYTIEELAKAEAKDQIIIETNLDTRLNIIAKEDETIIILPFGNKFDIINGRIHIKKY